MPGSLKVAAILRKHEQSNKIWHLKWKESREGHAAVVERVGGRCVIGLVVELN